MPFSTNLPSWRTSHEGRKTNTTRIAPTVKTATARYLVVEEPIRAASFPQVAQPISRLRFLFASMGQQSTHHFTRTSSHAPNTPIPTPVRIITSHIPAESSTIPPSPCSPLRDSKTRFRSRSAASSRNQSMVLPSSYATRFSNARAERRVSVSVSSVRSYASASRTSLSRGSALSHGERPSRESELGCVRSATCAE